MNMVHSEEEEEEEDDPAHLPNEQAPERDDVDDDEGELLDDAPAEHDDFAGMDELEVGEEGPVGLHERPSIIPNDSNAQGLVTRGLLNNIDRKNVFVN